MVETSSQPLPRPNARNVILALTLPPLAILPLTFIWDQVTCAILYASCSTPIILYVLDQGAVALNVVLVAYVVQSTYGIPCYVLLRRLKLYTCSAFAIAGAIPYTLFLAYLGGGSPDHVVLLRLPLTGAVLGFLSWCLIAWPPERH